MTEIVLTDHLSIQLLSIIVVLIVYVPMLYFGTKPSKPSLLERIEHKIDHLLELSEPHL